MDKLNFDWPPEGYLYPNTPFKWYNISHEVINMSSVYGKPDENDYAKERVRLIKLLESFEKSGLVKKDESEKILASNMTNDQLRSYPINLID